MGLLGLGRFKPLTRKLVEAVDIAEKKRGFKPPLFVDIRLQRTVRAKGFSGDAFALVVGASRYKWMRELGNRSIVTGNSRIEIDRPSYARELLKLAVQCHRQKRRILFFCSCEDLNTKQCHRTKVAALVLREAAKQGRKVAIGEWPGDKPRHKNTLRVKSSILKQVVGGRKSVPLGASSDLKEFAGLPWGSVVTLKAGEELLPVVSGPAKYRERNRDEKSGRHRSGWYLQVVHVGEIGKGLKDMKTWAVGFRRQKGLEQCQSVHTMGNAL
jgi:hypothetical protein